MKKGTKDFKDMQPHKLVHAHEKNWKDDFKPGFCTIFNLFWQILINGCYGAQRVAFTANVTAEGIELVTASAEGGYYHTGIFFNVDNYSEATLAAEQMSHEVFNITEKEAQAITHESMFGRKAKK